VKYETDSLTLFTYTDAVNINISTAIFKCSYLSTFKVTTIQYVNESWEE